MDMFSVSVNSGTSCSVRLSTFVDYLITKQNNKCSSPSSAHVKNENPTWCCWGRTAVVQGSHSHYKKMSIFCMDHFFTQLRNPRVISKAGKRIIIPKIDFENFFKSN